MIARKGATQSCVPERGITSFWFVLILNILAAGCATGSGVNRHLLFKENPVQALPFKVVVGDTSRSIETGAIMSDPSLSFLLFGMGGGAAAATPGAVGAMRGKFAAGEVFDQASKALSPAGAAASGQTLHLKLIRFQHYLVPGLSPGLKAVMEFSADFAGTDKTTKSSYAFSWKRDGMTILPGREKDVLREMVEYALSHWSRMLLGHYAKNASKDNLIPDFPPALRGQISHDIVEGVYEIFAQTMEKRGGK
ncbi:MAG: hypothetical protein AB1805_08865 [Nitrospirota bacterium]